MTNWLFIQGCSTQNLQALNVKFPIGKISIVTGPAGSGKSALVWHTLYNAAYLHYVESVSPSLRGRLEGVERPLVLAMENIPPTIADRIEAKPPGKEITIGRVVDAQEPIAVIFECLGVAHCPTCQRPLHRSNPDELVGEILGLGSGWIWIGCETKKSPPQLRELGFERTMNRGEIRELPPKRVIKPVVLLIDRFENHMGNRDRLFEALEQIQRLAAPEVVIWDGKKNIRFPIALYCGKCRIEYSSPAVQAAPLIPPENILLMEKSQQQWLELTVNELIPLLAQLSQTPAGRKVSFDVWERLHLRLLFLRESGLGGFSMARRLATLSLGERRRVRQAFLFGTELSDALLLFDHPGAGGDSEEITRMISWIKRLKRGGNTVIMVENRAELIAVADYIVELGPGSGMHGGQICFAGDVRSWLKKRKPAEDSIDEVRPGRERQQRKRESLPIFFDSGRKNVQIVPGALNVISGGVGSGKSRILNQMGEIWQGRASRPESDFPVHLQFAEYMRIDRPIRDFMAARLESHLLHFTAAHFSRRSPLGRCLECLGKGERRIDLQVLPSVRVPCPLCKGSGLASEVEKIRWRGRNIVEMMGLSIDDFIFNYSRDILSIVPVLERSIEMGIGHLKIGLPLEMTSVGERRLVSLASQVNRLKQGMVLLLDTPSFALQKREIWRILELVRRLCRLGHTVIAAENHPLFLQAAEWIIELSPSNPGV